MIHGLILIDKPPGITSHTVVDNVRKLFKIKKVGHFGTLDPLAEGLILIGMGNATKFFDFYIKKKKLYTGKITFGYATTTYDTEGEPTSEKKDLWLDRMDLEPFFSRIAICAVFSARITKSATRAGGKRSLLRSWPKLCCDYSIWGAIISIWSPLHTLCRKSSLPLSLLLKTVSTFHWFTTPVPMTA